MAYTFQTHTLPNGLTIIAELCDTAHSAAAGFFVKTGARDETPVEMGVSHFLEHMMFKGTEDLTAEALNRAFDEIGARNNAFTSNEMTCFYAHLLPEHAERGVELLCRMMRPALAPADFDTEKGVILEEIAMYEDNPFFVLYENSIEKHFGNHPMAHRVLGTARTITDLSCSQMRSYFERRYSSDNTVVALAGKLDFDAICRRIEAHCGAWRPTRVGRDATPPPIQGGELVVHRDNVSRGYLLAMGEAPPIADDRRHAASLLAQVLGAPDNSRLHWALIEPGIAEEAQASFDPHDGLGEFFVFASGDPGRLDEIWSTVQRELASVVESITPDDLERIRNKLLTGATLGGERPHDRMHRLGRLWTYLGRYTTLEAELDRISRVSLAEIRGVAEEFPLRPKTVGRLIPAA